VVVLVSPPLAGLLLGGAAVLAGWRRREFKGGVAAPSAVPDP
jgi:hypothetical protein